MKSARDYLTRNRRFGAALVVAAACVGALATSTVGAGASPSTKVGTEVSVETSSYGPVLDAGSGPFTGFTLYSITSDHGTFGCTPDIVLLLSSVELSCTEEWPPLLTAGAPVAGSGVKAKLLGRVFRKDIDNWQVTYAGHPLYLFENKPGLFRGERYDEPALPPWHGAWYLVSPTGAMAPGTATMDAQRIGSNEKVLGTVMQTHLGAGSFTVYAFSGDSFKHSVCVGLCAVTWPPVLSSQMPALRSGLLKRDFGLIRRDGTEQVTFEGKPLYLYAHEQLALGRHGPISLGNGNGVTGFGGTFEAVPV